MTLDVLTEFAYNYQGALLRQINTFSGSSGFSVTITPTAGTGTPNLMIAKIHWVIDTALASGGSAVSVQIFYQINGVDRIRWTAIFQELIQDEMKDDGSFIVANGSNSLTFGLSLGTLSLANGYFIFTGLYQ